MLAEPRHAGIGLGQQALYHLRGGADRQRQRDLDGALPVTHGESHGLAQPDVAGVALVVGHAARSLSRRRPLALVSPF
jgi:hypothetical protein